MPFACNSTLCSETFLTQGGLSLDRKKCVRYKIHEAQELEWRKEVAKIHIAKRKITLDAIRLKLKPKSNNVSDLGSPCIVFTIHLGCGLQCVYWWKPNGHIWRYPTTFPFPFSTSSTFLNPGRVSTMVLLTSRKISRLAAWRAHTSHPITPCCCPWILCHSS